MSWDCPNCGRTGNLKKFCGQCGCKRPEAEVMPEIVQPVLEPEVSANESSIPDIPAPDTASAVQPVSTAPVANNNTGGNNWQGKLPGGAIEGKKKPVIIAVCALLVVCLGFFAFKMLGGNDYASKGQEFISISQDVSKTAAELKKLPGTPSESERKSVSDGLQKSIDKLDKLDQDLKKIKSNKQDEAAKFQGLLALVEFDKEYLTVVRDIVNYAPQELGNMNRYIPEEYKALHKKYADQARAYEQLETLSIIIDDSKANKQNVQALSYVLWDEVDGALSEYLQRKVQRDSQYLSDIIKEANSKQAENNAELKKKDEVVFLVNKVYPMGKAICVEGMFYNGTKDLVSHIKEYLLDISLKCYGKEVFSVKDAKGSAYHEVFNLPPGGSAASTIMYHLGTNDNIPYYTTAEVNMHKIRWVVRREVKR
ncbi:MAG: hypothetical protein PHQ44_00605 [Anaerovibrio sp.]|nr:hypothetical protein [Anaerovibrio sp.]